MNLMQFAMIARIEISEFHNNRYYTIVTTPAPDAFSHPSKFKVQSDKPLGQFGQEVDLEVSVGGIVRENPYQDKQTRQPKVFYQADVYLSVINCHHRVASLPQASAANNSTLPEGVQVAGKNK